MIGLRFSRLFCPSPEESELGESLTLDTLDVNAPPPSVFLLLMRLGREGKVDPVTRHPRFITWARANARDLGITDDESA